MNPHKYAEVIKQWADGAQVQIYSEPFDQWYDEVYPSFELQHKYRIKPQGGEFVPDIHFPIFLHWDFDYKRTCIETKKQPNISFAFEGKTGKLKGVKLF